MKKIFFKIYTFIHYLFAGLHSADKVIMGSDDNNKDIGGGTELHDEEDSVYKDLLKGEVTQEVKELRYEMYQSEKKSKKYRYIGNGVVAKNNVFSDYGNIYTEDGSNVVLIQENKKIEDGLSEEIESNFIDFTGDYTIGISRDFSPRLRIEEYTNKIVIKKVRDDYFILDFYTTKYQSQFDRKHKIFLNEIEKVKLGDVKSDLVDFDEVSFITNNAYGSEDFNLYVYGTCTYKEIVDWNGDYIIRFNAAPIVEGQDLTAEYYDDIAQEKSDKHESRGKNNTVSAIITIPEDKEKTNKELELLKQNNIDL